ncbi:MAG: potassium/proton antiporter [Elusimicrobia bacterium]|nr:potassium/proton antiporter [Elusimicrobiota bacterium]
MAIETLLIVAGVLVVGSVLISKASERFGVPAMLIFLGVGMLAGSEGLGGIEFDNPKLAQAAGTVALAYILFAGGLETEWSMVRPVLASGMVLSTVGVAISAGLVGGFVALVLGFSWKEGLLLGSIIASTDAAAVFSVLKSKSVRLKGRLRPLLELESGSNDPMAVFLTVGMIGLIVASDKSAWGLIPKFFLQMGVGAGLGLGFGFLMRTLLNRAALGYEGLYPVLSLALVVLTYGVTTVVGGNGFLGVYVAGVFLGNSNFIHKRSLGRFHDGIAWLMQIGMFLTLGLLVFPSHVFEVMGAGLAVAAFLMLVARPVSVFVGMANSRFSKPEKVLVSWVGLRGAVPIVLATFPLLAGLPKSEMIFNIVFFVVLTSALVQGVSIPWVAKRLGLEAPAEEPRRAPLRLGPGVGSQTRLEDFILPYGSPKVGKTLVSLNMPKDSLIALIGRGERFVVPDGSTPLESGDVLWVLVSDTSLPKVRDILTESMSAQSP